MYKLHYENVYNYKLSFKKNVNNMNHERKISATLTIFCPSFSFACVLRERTVCIYKQFHIILLFYTKTKRKICSCHYFYVFLIVLY